MHALAAVLTGAVAVVAFCGSALAATVTYDFSTDPSLDPDFIIASNNPDLWQDTGGNPGGFLSITEAVNSQFSQILFPDFDDGQLVAAFSFECDLRIGNAVGNEGRPADGFSINYARAEDPQVLNLLANGPATDNSRYAVNGAPEAGTSTGIAISFDTWSGNALPDGPDIEGIIVRVDNRTVTRVSLPVRNGACENLDSLQTGPYNAELAGAPDELCWQKFTVNLAQNGELTVTYKGRVLLDNYQTGYAPGAGRLLFAGRTGGANENHHVDNVQITTIIAEGVLLTGVVGDPFGCEVTLEDVGTSVLDPETMVFKFNDVVVPNEQLDFNKVDTTTTIRFNTSLLPSGSQHTVDLEYQDTLGAALTGSGGFTVLSYATLPQKLRSPLGSEDTSQPGFNVRTWQLKARAITQPNNIEWAEGVLAGLVGENEAYQDVDEWGRSFVDGVFGETGVINYATAFGQLHGNFTPDDQHPGIPGNSLSTFNYQSDFVTYIPFAAPGLYTMGVNSDDNFRVTVGDQVGRQYLEVLSPSGIAGGMAAVASAVGLNANFGGPLPTVPIEGDVVYVGEACGVDPNPITEDLTGKIALTLRGTCTFVEKCRNAQARGALAVIVANSEANAGNFPIIMGGDGFDITIPVLMVDFPDGQDLINDATGLRVSIGKDTNVELGEYNANGRGATDTLFSFYVPQAGVYPFRCVYQQGDGDGNVEWFTVAEDGAKILVNGTAEGAIKGYRARTFTPPTEITAIGLNFGADETGGSLAATDVAGAPGVTQANWNNLNTLAGSSSALVGDSFGSAQPITATVAWTSANTWASTGRGEENNALTGANLALMTGYLDTGADTTSTVTISGISEDLTNAQYGYDVYVYALGGVAGRGGSYRVVDPSDSAVLSDYIKAQSPTSPTEHVLVPTSDPNAWGAGTYLVFNNLNAATIRIEATTVDPWGFGSPNRAPINAVQLVPSTSAPQPRFTAIVKNEDGSLTVTWQGQGVLQAAPSALGPWETLEGATSPYTIQPTDAMLFGRIRAD